MSTKKRAQKVAPAGTVISNCSINMGDAAEETAIIKAVQTALDVLYKINLTPRYGIYIEAKDESSY